MSDGLNKAMLIGNLGAEPELRITNSGKAVLKLRIATTESYQPDVGERKEVTHWHNIVLWGKRAEGLSKILNKGSRVYVEGRIENRSYDDKDGVKRNVSEIVASNLILLGGKGDAAGGRGFGGQREPKQESPRDEPQAGDFGGSDENDIIPF